MAIPEDLLDRVFELDRNDRVELVKRLLIYLEDEGPERDPDWEESWAAEIERRMKAVEEGRSKLLTWEEVRARLESRRRRSPSS